MQPMLLRHPHHNRRAAHADPVFLWTASTAVHPVLHPPLQYGKWRIWNGARKQQRKQRGAAPATRRRPVETGLDRMPHGFMHGRLCVTRAVHVAHASRITCVKRASKNRCCAIWLLRPLRPHLLTPAKWHMKNAAPDAKTQEFDGN